MYRITGAATCHCPDRRLTNSCLARFGLRQVCCPRVGECEGCSTTESAIQPGFPMVSGMSVGDNHEVISSAV